MRWIVDELPWAGIISGKCQFWNDNLKRMCRDLRRLWIRMRTDHDISDDFNLVRKVCPAMIVRSRYDYITDTFAKANDMNIFWLIRQLEAK